MFTRVQVRNKQGVQHVPYTLHLSLLSVQNIPPSTTAVFKYFRAGSSNGGKGAEITIGQTIHLDGYDVRQGKANIQKDFLTLPLCNSAEGDVIEIQCCAHDAGLNRDLRCSIKVYSPDHKMYRASGMGYADYELVPVATAASTGFFQDKRTGMPQKGPAPTISVSTQIVMNDVVKICHDISFSPVCVTDELPGGYFPSGFPPVVKKYLECSYERGLLLRDEVLFIATDITNMMYVLGAVSTWNHAAGGAASKAMLSYPPARMNYDSQMVLEPGVGTAVVQMEAEAVVGTETLYSASLSSVTTVEVDGESKSSNSSVQVKFEDEYSYVSWLVHLRKAVRLLAAGEDEGAEVSGCPDFHEAMVKISVSGLSGAGNKLRRQQSTARDYIPARCTISAATQSMLWIADPPFSKQLEVGLSSIVDQRFDLQSFPPTADYMLPVKLRRFLNFMLPTSTPVTVATTMGKATPPPADDCVQVLQIFRMPSNEAAIVLEIPRELTNNRSASIGGDDLPEAALFLSKADLELPPATVKYAFKLYSYFKGVTEKASTQGLVGVGEATVTLSALINTLPPASATTLPSPAAPSPQSVENIQLTTTASSFVITVGKADGLFAVKPGVHADLYCKIYLLDKAGETIPVNSASYFAAGGRSTLSMGGSQSVGENGSLRTPTVGSKTNSPKWDFTSNPLPLVAFSKGAGTGAGMRVRVVTQVRVVLFDRNGIGLIKKDLVLGEVVIPLVDALGDSSVPVGNQSYSICASSRMPNEHKTRSLGNVTIALKTVAATSNPNVLAPSVTASIEVGACPLVAISSKHCRWPCRLLRRGTTPAEEEDSCLYYLDVTRYDMVVLTPSSDNCAPADMLVGCKEERRMDDNELPCRRHVRVPLAAIFTEGSVFNDDCDCTNITELTSSCLVISFTYHRKFALENGKVVYREAVAELLVGPCAASELRKTLMSRYRMGNLRSVVVDACALKTEEDGMRDGNTADYPIAERNCSKEAMEAMNEVVGEIQIVLMAADRKTDYQNVYMNTYLRLLIYWYSCDNPANLAIIQSEFRASLKTITDAGKVAKGSMKAQELVGQIKTLAEATVLSLMLHSDSVPPPCIADDVTTDGGISLGYRIINSVHYVIETCYRAVVALIMHFTKGSTTLHLTKPKAQVKKGLLDAFTGGAQVASDQDVAATTATATATNEKRQEAETEQATRDLLNFLISRDDWLGQMPGKEESRDAQLKDSNISMVASVLRACGLVLNRKPVLSLCIDYNGMMVQFSQLLAKDVAYWSSRTTDQILREGANMAEGGGAGGSAENSTKLDLPWLFDQFDGKFMSNIPIDIQTFFQMQITLRQLPCADINEATVLKIRVLNSQIAAAIYRAYLNLAKWYLRHLGSWKGWDLVNNTPAHDGDLKFLISVVNDASVVYRQHLPECMSQLRLQGELAASSRGQQSAVSNSSYYDFSQAVDAFRRVAACSSEIIVIVLLTRFASSDYDFDSRSFHAAWYEAIEQRRDSKVNLLKEMRSQERSEMAAELEEVCAEPAEEAAAEGDGAPGSIVTNEEGVLNDMVRKASLVSSPCKQLVMKQVLRAMKEDINSVADLINENLYEHFLEMMADKVCARYFVLIHTFSLAVGDIEGHHGHGSKAAEFIGGGVQKVATEVRSGVTKVAQGVGKVTTAMENTAVGGHLKEVGGVLKEGVTKVAAGVDVLHVGDHLKDMLREATGPTAYVPGDDLNWEHDDVFTPVFGVEPMELLVVEQIIADILAIEEFFNGMSKRGRVFSRVFNQLHCTGVALQAGIALRHRANNRKVDHLAAAMEGVDQFSDSDSDSDSEHNRDDDEDDFADDVEGSAVDSTPRQTAQNREYGGATMAASIPARNGSLISEVGAHSAGIREALLEILLDQDCDVALHAVCRLCGLRSAQAAAPNNVDSDNVVDTIFYNSAVVSKRGSMRLPRGTVTADLTKGTETAEHKYASVIPVTFPSDEAMLKVCGISCKNPTLYTYGGISDAMTPVSYKISVSGVVEYIRAVPCGCNAMLYYNILYYCSLSIHMPYLCTVLSCDVLSSIAVLLLYCCYVVVIA